MRETIHVTVSAGPAGLQTPPPERPDADNIKPGDMVRLRSGGPWMTVESVAGSITTCLWFQRADHAAMYRDHDYGQLMSSEINVVSLEKRKQPHP